jgi:hypothetical protein
MREDCRHFESRSYPGGETARFCVLDLAPEAPWRCPENCSRYEPTLIDGTFQVGSLQREPLENEPDESPDDIEAVLDEAEAIVTQAEPDAIREIEARDGSDGGRKWWPFGRKRGDGRGGYGRFSSR